MNGGMIYGAFMKALTTQCALLPYVHGDGGKWEIPIGGRGLNFGEGGFLHPNCNDPLQLGLLYLLNKLM